MQRVVQAREANLRDLRELGDRPAPRDDRLSELPGIEHARARIRERATRLPLVTWSDSHHPGTEGYGGLSLTNVSLSRV